MDHAGQKKLSLSMSIHLSRALSVEKVVNMKYIPIARRDVAVTRNRNVIIPMKITITVVLVTLAVGVYEAYNRYG